MDYLLRVTGAEGQVRGFFAKTNEIAETARSNYKTTPVVTAAVGRTLTGTVIMGAMLKNENDMLTVTIKGDGPVKGIIATADSKGTVKGYAYEPYVILPLKANGKLDVSGAVGAGNINVIKDMGLKEPVTSTIPLATGEIAEDFTKYFAVSEQTPSAVALGVLVNTDLTVKQSGGFVVQLMPGASEDVVARLEENISKIDTVTNMMEKGLGPEEIMNIVLDGMNPVIHEKQDIRFACNCSRERAEGALRLIGEEEIKDILEKEGKANIHCHFCNKSYDFNRSELENLL
ncbi:Hsp33 family molecular chaperone HslO [Tyzzerella sp. OttesenSCG-928-J15]|nr:Hsp33 family molecular chaperone HslO [Tyzzerella sp. OttesenSCG-928-J15]